MIILLISMSDIFCKNIETIIPKLFGQTSEQKITAVKITTCKSIINKHCSFTHEILCNIINLSKPDTRNLLRSWWLSGITLASHLSDLTSDLGLTS